MPLNQLFHDHGVAQTRAQHADSADLRADSAAEARHLGHRIREQWETTPALEPVDDRFEVFRADEVQITSTQFAGGDWRWRLADAGGDTLVEGGGYRSERACQVAVSLLRERAFSAG